MQLMPALWFDLRARVEELLMSECALEREREGDSVYKVRLGLE